MTTHSFEDAELLSNKIGFLMDGELQCLGSLTHLKNKFKVGYELKVEFENPEYQQIIDSAEFICKFIIQREYSEGMEIDRDEIDKILIDLDFY